MEIANLFRPPPKARSRKGPSRDSSPFKHCGCGSTLPSHTPERRLSSIPVVPSKPAQPVATHDVLEVSESPDASPCVSTTNLGRHDLLTKRASDLHDPNIRRRSSWDSLLAAQSGHKRSAKRLPAASSATHESEASPGAQNDKPDGTKIPPVINVINEDTGQLGLVHAIETAQEQDVTETSVKQKPDTASDASLLNSAEISVGEAQQPQGAAVQRGDVTMLPSQEFLVHDATPKVPPKILQSPPEVAATAEVQQGLTDGAGKEDGATSGVSQTVVTSTNDSSELPPRGSATPQGTQKEERKATSAENGPQAD